MATPADQASDPAHLGPLARPALDMVVVAVRITTAKTMAAGNMAAHRPAAAEMVAAVMAIRAVKAAPGVTTTAADAGTPPVGLAVADLPTSRRWIVQVRPMTIAGPALTGARASRALIADPGAQPAAAGSGPTAAGRPDRARATSAAGKVAIGRSAAVARGSVAIGRSAAADRAAIGRSAVTGRAAIGRNAAASKAAIGRSARTGEKAASGTSAAAGRAAADGSRAASGRVTTGLRAEAVPDALATTGLQAALAGGLTIAAGQARRAGLALPGARIQAAATAQLPETMHAGPAKTRHSCICQRASPRIS